MISVTILTKNSQAFLPQVLEGLKDFQEVLIYDNGSTDGTLEIAKKFVNVKIHQGPFLGFGPTHNLVSELAANDWILSVDSDEVVTPELSQEILCLKLDDHTVYSIPRRNEYNGKWIRWCGWHPDRQARLYNRRQTRFSDAQVHEAVITCGKNQVSLASPLLHYSYQNITDFLAKMQSYSELFALQYRGKRSASPAKAIFHGFFAFFKSYILKRGILGGYEGFLISSYNAHTAFYKYLKLYEANQLKKL